MFDTVNFWLDSGKMAEGDPFSVLPYLSDKVETMADNNKYTCSGKLGNYQICCFENGIGVYGSLSDYYLPSNVCTLTRQTTGEALEKLSDGLHLDFRTAIVTRLDVSTIIPTKRQPTDYYSGLGNKSRFTRLQATPDTLYYRQKLRQLAFYDKTKEATAKGVFIPPALMGCNLLRYEMRFAKRVQRLFKSPEPITGATLTKSSFYHSIIQLWKREFDTISKVKLQSMKATPKTPKEAETAFFSLLLQKNNGQSCIDDFLNDLKAKKAFSDPKAYSRLKAKLYEILTAANGEDSELMAELETAIADIAKYAQ